MKSQLMKAHTGQLHRPLTTYEKQLLDFAKSSGLTLAQLLGEEQIALHKGANRPESVPRRELVWP
jgi:hypothetical protein